VDNYIDDMYSFRKDNTNFTKSLKYKQFDLYIDKKIKYKVKIFSNEKQMWEYDNDTGFYGKHKPYIQHYSFKTSNEEFIGYEDDLGNSYQDTIGEILLCEGCLSSRVVVHEITHAILYYFNGFIDGEFKNLSNNPDYEEAFCYLLGDCVSLVYNVLYDEQIIVYGS
jgi:hypothetical protein